MAHSSTNSFVSSIAAFVHILIESRLTICTSRSCKQIRIAQLLLSTLFKISRRYQQLRHWHQSTCSLNSLSLSPAGMINVTHVNEDTRRRYDQERPGRSCTPNTSHRRSVSGMVILLSGAAVVYKTRYHKTIALSSTEAEFVGASEAGKLILYLHSLLFDLGYPQPDPTTLNIYNTGTSFMISAQAPTNSLTCYCTWDMRKTCVNTHC